MFRMFIGNARKGWEKRVEKIAGNLVPKHQSRDWHNALMDFGATICTSKPKCDQCPFVQDCISVTKYKRTPEQLEQMASKTFKTTQSMFKGSNRFYRGQILKLLHERDGQSMTHFSKTLALNKDKLKEIVARLEKDGLVTKKKQIISLP